MLQVKNIAFAYQEKLVLNGISFSLKEGLNLAIIGESGCGKSTLLKLIYGLYDLEVGQISWNDVKVSGPKFNLIPGMNFMKYLAQDFDLMPFITAGENVGKFLSNFYPEQKKERIAELLTIVEMSEFVDVKTSFLSGGQMQRIAIARVLALEPKMLLLDEPFSHIDNFRKNSLRRKLFAYLKDKKITCLVATHDSTDVLSYADKVLVLKNGKVLKNSSPDKIYNTPTDKYIASLFGDVNEIIIDGKTILAYSHQLKVVSESDLKVKVTASYYKGSHYLIEAQYEEGIIYFDYKTKLENYTTIFLTLN